jgi:putative polysaccharide biosynthesis protein
MADQASLLMQDFGRSKPRLDILQTMHHAARDKHKPYGAQIREIFQLSMGDGRIMPHDYCYYRLYDDGLYTPDEKKRFVSESISHGLLLKCCNIHWWAAADDKFLAAAILKGYGAPIPETQAVFSRSGRNFQPSERLSTIEELSRFLAQGARFPLFAKPLGGVGSFGACSFKGYADGHLELADGSTIALDVFAKQMGDDQSYLFQSVLAAHPALQGITTGTSTVRVILILDDGRPEILHTIWKIPAGGNAADNFWRPGNLLADVDMTNGTVRRVTRGFGLKFEELTAHPDSGRLLRGLVLPDWDKTIRLSLDCAAIFSGLGYQSFDIALTPTGPVIVEVNTGSAFNLSQLVTGRGFLTDRFADFLRRNRYRLKLKRG